MILLIILSISSVGLLKLIDFSFDDGNILDWYYKYILRYEVSNPKLFKLLGGCIYCFGFWFLNLMYIVLVLTTIELSFATYLIYIGLSVLLMFRLINLF
jgi:hypothetical protein